jgi:hypothetical protein
MSFAQRFAQAADFARWSAPRRSVREAASRWRRRKLHEDDPRHRDGGIVGSARGGRAPASSLSDLTANSLILLNWYYFLEAKLLSLFKGLEISMSDRLLESLTARNMVRTGQVL